MNDSAATPPPKAGFGKRFHAWLMAKLSKKHDQELRDRKKSLLGQLTGTVVEIGPGTGINLKHYPRDIRWIGIEPNPFMHDYLRAEAARLGIETVDVRRLEAERLPVEDNSVDAVVGTLVLCSVHRQSDVLAEALRVLKPGGRFIFIEHVAAREGTRLRRIQNLLTPFWRRFGDGCHPNRETWTAIEQAGFARVEQEKFDLPLGPVGPHLAGVAVKAAG